MKLRIIALLMLAVLCSACRTTDTGTVNVVTYKGKVESVQRPGDFYSTLMPYRESFAVNVKTFTEKVENVKVFSKDNTPIILGEVLVTAHTDDNVDLLTSYVGKFGFEEKARHDARIRILESQTETEARKAFHAYEAYDVYSQQDAIQTDLYTKLKKIFAEELFLTLESVQFGNWHFENPSIEAAASAVVAARKQKEAEQAQLDAAKINQEKRTIEAQVFSNPALMRLELAKYALWITQSQSQAIGQHQGPLTIINGQQPQTMLQIPTTQ